MTETRRVRLALGASRPTVRRVVARAGLAALVLGVTAGLAAAADIAPGSGAGRGRIVAGPIIGGTVANNGFYAYGPYETAGPPLPWSPLYGPAVPVAPGCYMQRQRIWTEYGWRWRSAPICY